jgi:predicted secreted hydrolase
MSADRISRRTILAGLPCLGLGLGVGRARAQGFAGLGGEAAGFAPVVPGRKFVFPDDFGAHPEFRIEWWYVTANLRDVSGAAYGAQWTLFRQATAPGPQREGWANQQVWMGHAAVTSATAHRFSEMFARGGVGQAGVEAAPFEAWIDAWRMSALSSWSNEIIAPLQLDAAGADFDYALRLDADRPLVLQGDHGYSRKSERGQASYYYSQPYFTATGNIKIGDQSIAVSGQAWLDREWSSQPLAADQTGWDWF